LFALDFFESGYICIHFHPDGGLDIVDYQAKGRDKIRRKLEEARPVFVQSSAKALQGPYRPTGRHNITDSVLKIEGDTAFGTAYWFHYGNSNPERRAQVDRYGHYEDKLVKVNGQWLFSKRKIYSESVTK